jgi:hypothetical protein
VIISKYRVVMVAAILGYREAKMRTTLRLTTVMMMVMMVADE